MLQLWYPVIVSTFYRGIQFSTAQFSFIVHYSSSTLSSILIKLKASNLTNTAKNNTKKNTKLQKIGERSACFAVVLRIIVWQ
jgi:hypothetical protein